MSSPSPPLPESFGRYEVQALIGEGSMGRVYRAFDPLAHRVVAIKTLKAEYLASDTREEYLKRFRREAQAAGALSHPHIITVFDVGEDFFVMELLEGATLQAILRERRTLDPPEALRILAALADALDYAHSKGTIHRDVKPGNIMVLPDGRPKIMDFGVAHLTSTVMTAAGQFLGSPSYMAPEQIMKSEASPASDLFSFAVLAYEATTGRKPFEGESITTIIYKVVHEQPPPPRTWNLTLPARYDEIFQRALDKEPERRFPSARAFVAALEAKEIDAALAEAPTLPPLAALPTPPEAIDTYDLKAEDAAKTMPGPPAARATTPARPSRVKELALLLALTIVLTALAYDRGLLPWEPPPETAPAAPVTARPAPAATPATTVPAGPVALRIETEPPGATVSLDDTEAGVSPLEIPDVPVGVHAVRVARDGFAPAQLSFELAAGISLAPLRFVLQPTKGRLQLRSSPDGAAATLDGHDSGVTPIQDLFLDPGPHDVRLERKGYHPWTRRIEARVGETVDLEARLEKAIGKPRATPPAATPTPVAPVREGDLVALTDDVTAPRKISGDPPPYPEAASKLRLEGLVVVDMIISETGEPSEVRILESAGELLDRAVLDTVAKWRFEPAVKDGVKVRVHWQTRQRFEIKK